MYHKEKSVLLRASASALVKNVAVLPAEHSNDKQVHVAVIHKSTVNVVKPNAEKGVTGAKEIICKDSSGPGSGNESVVQVKWCTVRNRTLLVVGYLRGIQIYDEDGSALLFWHVFKVSPGAERQEMFARGITSCCNSMICVGTYDGEILMFDIPEKGTSITHIGSVYIQANASNIAGTSCGKVVSVIGCPIADLSSQDNLLVGASTDGVIMVWDGSNHPLKKVVCIDKHKSACSTIACWSTLIIAGYGNGIIRMFNLLKGTLHAEVHAHAKWISGLDVAPSSGMVISASEDSYVRVWELADGKTPSIHHKYSECIHDKQLCGVAFCDDDGSSYSTAGYDDNELVFYSF
ncbi:WDR54 (predicted) [Pycnogonum litorale]